MTDLAGGISGTLNSGVWVGGAPGGPTPSGGLKFAGTKSSFATLTSAALPGLNDAGTVMAWMKKDANAGSNWVATLGGDPFTFLISLESLGSLRAELKDASGNFNLAVLATPPPGIGEWHHIALSWNLSAAAMYVDGSLVTSQAISGPSGSQSTLYLGSSNQNNDRVFNGVLDEVKVFNEFLNEVAVQNAMSPFDPPAVPVVFQGAGTWTSIDANGNIQLTFTGDPGVAYEVEWTTNLPSASWVVSGLSVTGAAGAVQVSDSAVNVIPGAQETVLRLRIWDQPHTLNSAETFTMGLQATPVKPLPVDWHQRSIAGNVDWYGSDGSAALQDLVNLDVKVISSGENWAAIQNYPEAWCCRQEILSAEKLQSNGSIPTAVWKHIAASWDADAGTAVFYIDGVAVDQFNDFQGLIAHPERSFVIGGDKNVNQSRQFDGIMDEVRVYDRFLSAAEVLQAMGGAIPAGNQGHYRRPPEHPVRLRRVQERGSRRCRREEPGLKPQYDQIVHILFPALTARALVRPGVRAWHHRHADGLVPPETGHAVKLMGEPEEDELLFLHVLDTQFITLFTPLAFDDREHPGLRFYDRQPASRRRRSVRFFTGCLQRQIYRTGKPQVVAKLTYSIHRFKTLKEAFPDARFVFLFRPPAEVIPSCLSMHHALMRHQWGLERIPPRKLEQFIRRIYSYSIELYRYVLELKQEGGLTPERVMMIPADRLHQDVRGTVGEILDFCGIEPRRGTDKVHRTGSRHADPLSTQPRSNEPGDLWTQHRADGKGCRLCRRNHALPLSRNRYPR
jgi:hypothetical protein